MPRGTFMVEMPKRTLAGLDRAVLRERAPTLDPTADHGFPFRSAEDKLSALRLDPLLVEVYASEQGTDLLQVLPGVEFLVRDIGLSGLSRSTSIVYDLAARPDVALTWAELVAIVAQADGSAYGAEGIWGRWVGYAKSSRWHNDYEGLFALFERDPMYAKHFRFSLLYVVSRATPKAEVIALETQWKERLGSRAVGLGYNQN